MQTPKKSPLSPSPATLTFLVVLAVTAFAGCLARSEQATTGGPAPEASPPSRPAATFDEGAVRDELFAALEGDDASLARAEQACDDALRADPRNAEALVQHGIATSMRAWRAARAGDGQGAGALWARASSEMDRAVTLAPDDVGVRIPRGSALFGIATGMDDPALAKECLTKAVGDYEATLHIQGAAFNQRPLHDRSELLWGLAEGWQRLGNPTQANEYFTRLVAECSPSPLALAAKQRLEGHDVAPRPSCKDGCHS